MVLMVSCMVPMHCILYVKLWAPGGGAALQEGVADLFAQAGGGVRQEQGGAPVHRANVAQHVEIPAGPEVTRGWGRSQAVTWHSKVKVNRSKRTRVPVVVLRVYFLTV